MNGRDEGMRESQALKERLTRLSEACLLINESLDLDAVLQAVLDSARSLTDADYAVITTLDESGQLEYYRVSGMGPDEVRRLWEMEEGPRVYEYLNGLAGPLRVKSLLDHVRLNVFPDFSPPAPISSFLATPIRHRGESVGIIHVARSKPGVEFTQEDEDTLVMFASQVALVLANARRHRDERRAREDLEALIDTSPIGVVVIDANGAVVSSNREAARIMEPLRLPDHPTEHLIEVVTIRRGDGRELSLQELTLAQAVRLGETVRAEEVVFRVPDGRSVTVMMNATILYSEEGEFESMVATLQDMTDMQALERQRAEFLGMVSHELRAPLSSIKGSAATVIGSQSSLDRAEMELFFRIIDQQADHMSELISDLLDVARIETGTLSVDAAPCDPNVLVDESRNAFLSAGSGRDIQFNVEPGLPRVLADRLRVAQVLSNLLSNAARHSPESSVLKVGAALDGNYVSFTVTDFGVGLSAEDLSNLFGKHTRNHSDQHREGIGMGIGLLICRGLVEAHGGRIWADSDGPGLGTRFTFTLPTADQAELSDATRPMESGRQAGRNQVRVLAVDDDPQMLSYVRHALSDAGLAATVTGDPAQVGRLIGEVRPHLVLLDLMLPGVEGTELMKTVPGLAELPVIFLSAHGRDQTIARVLESGAVDYIVKPFSPTELVARINTALKRGSALDPVPPSEPYRSGELTINFEERTVSLAGDAVPVTDTEYRLLAELATHGGQVLSNDHILRRVWGVGHAGHSGPIRTTIKNLRRKLGDHASNPTYVFNTPRVGYRMPKGVERGDQG